MSITSNLKKNKIKLGNYNLERTLLGGQAFNWDKIDGQFVGFTEDKIIFLKQFDDFLEFQIFPDTDESFIRSYLNLEFDYENMLLAINKDEYIASAIKSNPGLRIIKQDFKQTLLSFILTSHKNIKAVRKVVRDLRDKYGDEVIIKGKSYKLFPKIERLKNVSEEELRKLGLGFRAKYFVDAVKAIDSFGNTKLSKTDAREFLNSIKGIGDKIADCILVFGLGDYSITPLDIWAKRVLIDYYEQSDKAKYSDLSEWYSDYFGEHTAWAGQFLFEHIRQNYRPL